MSTKTNRQTFALNVSKRNNITVFSFHAVFSPVRTLTAFFPRRIQVRGMMNHFFLLCLVIPFREGIQCTETGSKSTIISEHASTRTWDVVRFNVISEYAIASPLYAEIRRTSN